VSKLIKTDELRGLGVMLQLHIPLADALCDHVQRHDANMKARALLAEAADELDARRILAGIEADVPTQEITTNRDPKKSCEWFAVVNALNVFVPAAPSRTGVEAEILRKWFEVISLPQLCPHRVVKLYCTQPLGEQDAIQEGAPT
jgi:hypothetical protein